MAKVARFFKTLRNNPKKTIVFSLLGTLATKFAIEKYEEEQLLAHYCREAQQFGEQRHGVAEAHRHITVLLNPAAAGGKCKAQFDKYCAPLLHLAGLKVAVVRTEHQGQAKDLMAVMDKTDGVVVAGGDGTLSEVLTGLLRRTDVQEAVLRLPLSVLPLGSNSVAGRAVHGITGHRPEPRDLLEATMAVVRQLVRPMDVIEVTPLSEGAGVAEATAGEQEEATLVADECLVIQEGASLGDEDAPLTDGVSEEKQEAAVDSPKPIFVAGLLEWGAYRDAWERRDKYWYWASLRRYVTYVFSSYKDLSWDCSSSLSYSLPCSGCSSCYVPPKSSVAEQQEAARRSKSWYHFLLPDTRAAATQSPEMAQVDYSAIINPECGVLYTAELGSVCDVRISSRNTANTAHTLPHQLVLQAGAADTTTAQFISEGWQRSNSGHITSDREYLVGSVTIRPGQGAGKNKKGEEREFSLDGEGFEVRPVTLRARPRAVNIFAAPPLAS